MNVEFHLGPGVPNEFETYARASDVARRSGAPTASAHCAGSSDNRHRAHPSPDKEQDMTDPATPPQPSIPPDDPHRHLTVARPDDDETLTHLGIVGDTYTILVTGDDTAGKYTLIDMHVPPGGGPPPHRHDFEEVFTVLEGEVELTFRDEYLVASRTERPPALDEEAQAAFIAKSKALAPEYRTELLLP
jgi:mannose-6-phosphate isomerase-like protein (cupin superfamily)